MLFPMQNISIFNFIYRSLKPFRWQVLGLILVACYWSIHISLQPYIIKLILDHCLNSPSFSNLLIPAAMYILLSLGFNLNFRFYDYVSLNLYPKLKANIINDTTNKISHLSYPFFQNQLVGSLSDKIKNLSQGVQEITQLFLDRFFSHFLALVIACITLMSIHFLLPIILLLWTTSLVGISLLMTRKGRVLSHQLSESNNLVVGSIVDRFSNILNVRLLNGYTSEKKQLTRKLSTLIKNDKKLRWFLLKTMFIQSVLTTIMISACLILMVFLAQSKQITIGDFALVLTLTLSFADIIFNLTQEISKFSEVYGLVSQGILLFNEKIEIDDAPHAQQLVVTKGEIRFNNVYFNYPNSDALFTDKSITLYSGQKIGLVGYSGSGKSTFLNLILRLFDVTQGNIYIDNQDIKTVTQLSLHRAISIIPQDPTLFHRSLIDNIRYGTNADKEEVILAAHKANAHEFIENLPLSYDTLVGERGVKLSGGQRQRIAIARAFLKNAPILLLDEATSSLDPITETLIKNSLNELMQNKTTLIITHRLSTLLNMDRILVFNQGKIVEEGSHEELLTQGGLYQSLWKTQADSFIDKSLNKEKDPTLYEFAETDFY